MKNLTEEVKECLQIQDKLNSQIDKDWIQKRSLTDFVRAIWVECAEAIDSTGWKWWKNNSEDFDNLKIEVVDIFHFLLSLMILLDKKYEIDTNIVETFSSKLDNEFSKNTFIQLKDIRFRIEKIVFYSIARNYNSLIEEFPELVSAVFSNADEFINLYKAKVLLNEIRNKYGYKDGSYNKIIEGKEDNQILLELVAKYNNFDELKKELLKMLKIENIEEEKKNEEKIEKNDTQQTNSKQNKKSIRDKLIKKQQEMKQQKK